MAKCPKCGANYEGHPSHCPGCGVKFVFKPASTVLYQRQGLAPHRSSKCPKCGALFEGHPDHCPNCRVQLVYMTIAVAPNNGMVLPYNPTPANMTKTYSNAKPNLPAQAKPQVKQLPAKVEPADLDLRFVDHPLKTNRGVFKFFFLNLITLGIYSFVYFHKWGKDLNRIRRYNHDLPRIGYVAAFFLGFITLGIVPLIWFIRRTASTYKYARKEGVACGSSVFWFLSYFIVLSWTVVCPIIAAFQLVRTMNRLCKTLNDKSVIKNK